MHIKWRRLLSCRTEFKKTPIWHSLRWVFKTTPISSIDQDGEGCDYGLRPFYGLPKPHFGVCARATRARWWLSVLDTHCYYTYAYYTMGTWLVTPSYLQQQQHSKPQMLYCFSAIVVLLFNLLLCKHQFVSPHLRGQTCPIIGATTKNSVDKSK